MNTYELTLIVPEKASSAKKKSIVESVEKMVKTFKGDVKKKEGWGEIELSYPIKKSRVGSFFHFDLDLPQGTVKTVNDKLRVESDIIRYLLIRSKD